MRLLVLLFLFFFPCLCGEELTVDLKHPQYENGVLFTHQGGVISSPNFTIQGRHIAYTHLFDKNKKVQQISGEGDLMFTTQKQTYVGRRLEYDFITKRGVLYDGVTAFNVWFLRGETIALNEDRSLSFSNASITTSEGKTPDWHVHIKEGSITSKHLLAAKNISFYFLKCPIFWLPIFKSNLKTLTHSPIKYRMDWDRGLYPKLSLRYCIYSWDALSVYLRLNIRPSKGIGGSLETDYRSFDKRLEWRTRNYLDKDTFYRDMYPKKAHTHYRMQGKYVSTSLNERTQFLATYDYLSDKNMQSDFESKDFERQTAKETKIRLRNHHKRAIIGVDGDFRINSFEGMLQKLPEVFCVSKPFQLGSTGILSENQVKGGYLSYVSAKDLQKTIPDFNSVRLSTHHLLYRPFYLRGMSFTPTLGLDTVFYGNTQNNRPATLTTFTYACLTHVHFRRHYQTALHVLTPYLDYRGMSDPSIDCQTPYIFSIEDGFHKLNVMKCGVRSLLYLKKLPLAEPNCLADLYIYSFLGNVPFKKIIPKMQGTLTWHFPSWRFISDLGWNFEKQKPDYANVQFAWTVHSDFAFSSEWRYRSPFDWRKGDRDNFIMEVTHPIASLRLSPLSDRRHTFLTRLQIQLNPEWVMRLESHMGWGREKEPRYQEAKVQFLTTISTSWRLRLTFIHSLAPCNRNNHFSFSLSLIKKQD